MHARTQRSLYSYEENERPIRPMDMQEEHHYVVEKITILSSALFSHPLSLILSPRPPRLSAFVSLNHYHSYLQSKASSGIARSVCLSDFIDPKSCHPFSASERFILIVFVSLVPPSFLFRGCCGSRLASIRSLELD